MGDKKHKHKSKEKKKDRDGDRHRNRKRDERSRSRDRTPDRSREKTHEKRRDRSRDKYREVSKRRSRSRSPNNSTEYGHSSRYDSHHNSRHERNRSPKREYRSTSRTHTPERHTKEEDDVTNLVNFSFFDYKSELTKVLLGYMPKDKLVNDSDDFWLFLKKYETTLRNTGRSILPEPLDEAPENADISGPFHRSHCTKIKFSIPFNNLYGRLSSYEQSTKLSERRVKQFLQIVLEYLDFRQKEKFMKIRKLRQMQAELPVAKYKQEIIEAVAKEQVVLVAGDTGCGKSTQIPQYLRQAGYESICCTQPRRIACISLSKRVAHEMLCEYSNEVGYQIRFERSKNKDTKIIFMTEGLLLRQLSTEAALTQFDVIVLDEVHERHLHGDFLLGVTKCLLKARPELKLVLMSATINVKLFADYFIDEKVHVIEVPGRLFPIKLHYRPTIEDGGRQSKAERLSPEPYIQIMQMIDSKYPKTEKGDLLIFMSGLNEITTVVDAATEYAEKNKNWIILPLHSSLSIADQDKVFDYAPDGIRKCIVSTNIAETSVTIDGIRFVVDSGKMKEMSYDPQTKMQRLKEFWISKASAKQRMGRAGRTGPGICYRIYAEKSYSELEEYSQAEIHRVPLESLLLQMISMGLPDARLFPFIEPPAADAIEDGLLSLKKHDALTANEKVTALGMALSKLPVEISIGKMLLMGCVFEQVQPVLTMAAALSVQSPFTNRAYRDHECEAARKDLESDHGDPITVLNAYKEWLELKQGQFNRRNESTKSWCRRRGLEEQRFYEITKLRKQFEELLKDSEILSKGNDGEMTATERIIRKGELRQLKQMQREHKNEVPKKRKLKMNQYIIENEDEEDNAVDIRDVDFRLSNDASKIDNLVSGATANTYRDLITLKLIVLSGLYPQVAISDEFNHLKAPGQQFYHTEAKPFTSLHPMGYFANNPQILQLTAAEISEPIGNYRSKLPLSSRHQLLCYLSLLETTKPYLMNTLRMPAAQTLLLFAHSIDTNSTFSKIICDSWLCLEFPQPESGQSLLYKASNLRRTWNNLLANKLESMTKTVESELASEKRKEDTRKLEYELWSNLITYINSDVLYTVKRLLPADLKTLYVGPMEDYAELLAQFNPNPFADDFECTINDVKGGIYITENILYASVRETGWSLEIALMIGTTEWTCPNCTGAFCLTGIQKLQHVNDCKAKSKAIAAEEQTDDKPSEQRSHRSNAKLFSCPNCKKDIYLTSIEILKHKKTCK